MSKPIVSLLTIMKHLLIWLFLYWFLQSSFFNITWGWTISPSHATWLSQLYGLLTNAIIFYGTAFYLIPTFYNQHKRTAFTTRSMMLLSLVLVVELGIDNYIGEMFQNKSYQSALELAPIEFVIDGLAYILPVNLFYYLMAFAYRLPINRRQQFEREINLQRGKLEAELKYLKAQIHPHTLFNGMSNIYHLIDSEPEKAKSLVLNLSNALRYQLYESGEQFVPLEKELAYLRQYIALQEVRIDEDAFVEARFPNFEGEYLIAPLLFTPYIENAFKYISHFAERPKNCIRIDFQVLDNELHFTCMNTIDSQKREQNGIGGIGLQNVSNRLQLLYPNAHELKLENVNNTFTARLKLQLQEINAL